MIDLKQRIGDYLLGPKVIHRVPGRLRVSVPAIRRIPSQFNGIANRLIDKVRLPNGVKTVDLNFISGNILIHYHVNQTEEAGVMGWLNDLYVFLLSLEKRLAKLPESEKKKAASQVFGYLENADSDCIDLEKKEAIVEAICQ
ncbi:MAG: HMA2 domain-containing protein [Syntrophobacteraceae bacterium]